MALEIATQGTINSLLSSVPSQGVSADISTSVDTAAAEDAASDDQSLPSLFAALMATQSDSDSISLSGDSATEGILDTSLLSSFTSDDAIATMQNNLLGALQNNVFAALTAAAAGTTAASGTTSSESSQATTVDIVEAATEEPVSMMDSMMTSAFGENGLDLNDGFDALNILNHLPIISDIYEETTETHAATASSLTGSFIYGGVGGLLYNVADIAVEGMTGKSISATLWDFGKQVVGGDAAAKDTSVTSIVSDEILSPSVASSAYDFVKRNLSE